MKWVVNRNLPHTFWNFVGACGARRGALWSISFWALLRLLTVVPLSKSREVDFPSVPGLRRPRVTLKALAKVDERKSQVVELRFFGGLTVEETAEVLKVSPDTVARDWRLAKAWLLREMSGKADGS
jgi:hypothetical protein